MYRCVTLGFIASLAFGVESSAAIAYVDFATGDTPSGFVAVGSAGTQALPTLSPSASITTANFAGTNSVGTSASNPATGAAAVFGSALSDSIYGIGPATGLITFTGLNAGQGYDFVISATRANTTDRPALYQFSDGQAAALDAASNYSNVASVGNVVADAAGEILLSVSDADFGLTGNSSNFYYIGALSIADVPEPSSLSLAAAGGLLVLRRRR